MENCEKGSGGEEMWVRKRSETKMKRKVYWRVKVRKMDIRKEMVVPAGAESQKVISTESFDVPTTRSNHNM